MDRQRILVIADEGNVRETIRLALEVIRYEVKTAQSGPAGLAQFGSGEAWDLVLLDQRTPAKAGLYVLRQIQERDPEARLVLVTGQDAGPGLVGAGASGLLPAPFTLRALRRVVQSALALPRRRPDAHRYSLRGLLPDLSPDPAFPPRLHFRTLNGLRFWPLPLAEQAGETAPVRIRRVFEVQPPSGGCVRCAVDVTTAARRQVTHVAGRELSPTDTIWDVVCRTHLSARLWERAELPPETLPVRTLTREQVELVRSMSDRDAGVPRR